MTFGKLCDWLFITTWLAWMGVALVASVAVMIGALRAI